MSHYAFTCNLQGIVHDMGAVLFRTGEIRVAFEDCIRPCPGPPGFIVGAASISAFHCLVDLPANRSLSQKPPVTVIACLAMSSFCFRWCFHHAGIKFLLAFFATIRGAAKGGTDKYTHCMGISSSLCVFGCNPQWLYDLLQMVPRGIIPICTSVINSWKFFSFLPLHSPYSIFGENIPPNYHL